MHDAVQFESNGLPHVFVLSTEFAEAAQVQAEALGLPEVRRVFVPHPIQDATDEEMRMKAQDAIDAIVEALTANG